MTRVAVFIDYQNVYMRAREAFAAQGERFVAGQVDPLALGDVVVSKGLAVDPRRRLHAVKVFRGEPSAKHSPTGQAACQRQVQAWMRNSVVEVAAWQPTTGYASSLRLPGMWCHRLRVADYQSVADRRDYSAG